MKKRIRIRTMFIGGCFTILFFILLARVFWFQVANAEFWQVKAKETWSTQITLNSVRGTIYDRNGSALAMDAPAYTVAVSPKIIDHLKIADEVVDMLHGILNKPKDELYKIATAKKDDGEFYQQREVHPEGWKVDVEVAERLKEEIAALSKETEQKDVGIYLLEMDKRYYPKETLASHILGYMDKEDKPVNGLESYYDELLRGIPGSISYEKDRKGYKLPTANEVYKPKTDGKNIVLTIDETIQHYTEKAIKAIYDQYKPVSVTAIAADPKTMEILAMANMPNFNPNSYWEAGSQAAFYDHAIRSIYEPGSTFKIVTLAAAVEEGLFNPNEWYMSGQIKVKGWPKPIRDVKRGGWGEITLLEGVKRSSNVAFVKLGIEKLGEEKVKQYIHDFGFGQKTGIELPGESKGTVSIERTIDVATATFGQGGVVVTPIQQVAGIAAVANGGTLLKPHIIKEIVDPVTGEKTKTEPEVVRKVISEETSRKVGEYLEQVVSDQKIGSGRNAYIEGYRVAGKTGTAQKAVNGKYVDGKYVVSFIGYAPVEDPKILVYIIVDEPNDPYAGGGSVAAPAFKEIVSQSLRYMNIPSNKSAQQTEKKEGKEKTIPRTLVPSVTKQRTADAKSQLTHAGITFETIGDGDEVIGQYPEAGLPLPQSKRVYLFTEDPKNMDVPDMKGASLRDVIEMCSLLGIDYSVSGEGYVVEQTVTQNGDVRKAEFTLEPSAPSDSAEDESEKAEE